MDSSAVSVAVSALSHVSHNIANATNALEHGHQVAQICEDKIPTCILQSVANCDIHHGNCSNVITALIFPFLAIVIGCIAEPLTKYIKLPYTLVLLFTGFFIGIVGCKADLGYLTPSLQQWIHLRPPNLFFYIFLAPLIFEAAFVTQWHIFKRLLIPILTAAFVIVILQCGLIAGFTWGVVDKGTGWTWWSALMFGAMLSATDPISVTATLKALGASENLGTMIEGESLVNDGSAFVLWETFFHNSENLKTPDEQYSVGAIVLVILKASIGGMLLGVLFALVSLAILTYVYDEFEVETSLTVVVAFLGFWAAQSPAKLSGVICNVASGLVLSAYGRPLVSKSVRHGLEEFWHLFGWIANTIVFIHAGILTVAFVWPCSSSPHSAKDYLLIFGFFIYLQVIRVALFMGFLPILSFKNKWFTWKENLVVGLSGLRGAVSLILALNVAGAGPIAVEVRSRVVLWTAGIIALSLIVNGLMIPYILHWLKLDGADKTREDFLRKARATMTQHTLGTLDTLCVDIGYKAARWSYVLQNVIPDKWLKDDEYGEAFASAAEHIQGNAHTHRLSLEFMHSAARRASHHADMRHRSSSEMFRPAPGSQQPARVSLSHAPATSIAAPPYSRVMQTPEASTRQESPAQSQAPQQTPQQRMRHVLSERSINSLTISPVYEAGHQRRSLEFDINHYNTREGEKWSKRINTELEALRGKQINAQLLADDEADFDTAHDREVRRRMLMSMLSQVRALSNATLIEYSALVSLEEDVQRALDANDENDSYDLFSKLNNQSLYTRILSRCIDEKKFSGETIVAASAVFSILTEILKQEQVNISKRVRREAEQLYEGAAYLLNRLETFNPKAFRWVHSQFVIHMTAAKQDAALSDMMGGGVIDAYEHKVLHRDLVAVRRRHATHARTMWRKQKNTPRELLPYHPLFVDKSPMFKELTSQPVITLAPGHRLRLDRGTLVVVLEGALRPIGHECFVKASEPPSETTTANHSSTSGSGTFGKNGASVAVPGGGGSAHHWCYNRFSGFCGASLACALNNEEGGKELTVAECRIKETQFMACDIAESTTVFTMPASAVAAIASESKEFRDEVSRGLAREIVLESVGEQATHHLRQINEALSNSIDEHTVIGRAFRILQRLPYMSVIRLHSGQKVGNDGTGMQPLQVTLQGPGVLINGVVRVSVVDTSGLQGAANLLHERLEGPALLPAGGLILQEAGSEAGNGENSGNGHGGPMSGSLGPVLAHVLVEHDIGLEGGARKRIQRWTADTNAIDMNGRFGMFRHITNCAHQEEERSERIVSQRSVATSADREYSIV